MAEIRQKIISCSQGHYYDANRYDQCPYCSAGGFSPTIDPFAAGESKPGSTVGPLIPGDIPHHAGDVQVCSFTPTIDPNQPGGLSERMGKTQYVDASTPAGTPAPVVGWLVCVDGPVRGTDFRIHAGYNYIGRESGDIHIHGDQQISRQNHAMIAFDSSELTYYVGPSAGRNLIKVNGKTVLNAVEIHSYDVISIGTTKLMFVALCGEHFRWDVENSHE